MPYLHVPVELIRFVYIILHHRLIIATLIILWNSNYLNCLALPAKVELYRSAPGSTEKGFVTIDGAECPFGGYFTETVDKEFDCACITGVWAFYQNKCDRPALIAAGVDNHCFELKINVHKVALLSSPSGDSTSSSVAIFNKEMTTQNGRLVLEGTTSRGIFDEFSPLEKNVIFITSGNNNWTLKGAADSCLQPEQQNTSNFYCSFGMKNDFLDIADVKSSCDATTTPLVPLTCSPFLTGSGRCPSKSLSRSLATNKSRQQGRVFLTGSTRMKNYTSGDTNFDNSTVNEPLEYPNSSAEIKSEIWNYMLNKAEKIAGLREDVSPTRKQLAFRLLEMSSTILQNTCPDHYVKDMVYEVSVNVFINAQSNAFKFEEEPVDLPTEKRIIHAISQCKKNLTEPYPFHDRRKSYYNDTATLCRADVGTFKSHGTANELSIAPNVSSLSYDPIIDTAWQTFIHAHSACYPFFIHSDHHRFTTIMMALFTNGINDLWYRGELSLQSLRDPYSNALGNSYYNMMFLNHCSVFPRLESAYPWDLIRPTIKSSRGKRSVADENDFQCMKDKYINDC